MATPSKPPKVMSNRLSGMKFMQRSLGSPATPSTPGEPAAKRQRLSNGSNISPAATANDTRERISHTDTTQRGSFNKEETKWYLSYKAPQAPVIDTSLQIVSAGYSSLDASEQNDAPSDENQNNSNEHQNAQLHGRKSFGKFNRKVEKKQDPDRSASEVNTDEEEEDEREPEDDPTGVKALIAQGRKEATDRVRTERKARKLAESAESAQLAARRRKREVNMNHSGGISSGGSRPSGDSQQGYKNMVCYRCGGKGHPQKLCPQKSG